MPVEITIPSPGESISEVTIGAWLKADGDWVEKDELLVEIESDKATLEISAPESGVLHIAAREGEEMKVGQSIGRVDADARKPSGPADGIHPKPAEPQPETTSRRGRADADRREPAEPVVEAGPSSSDASANEVAVETAAASTDGGVRATSLARKIASERGIDLAAVAGSGPSGRVTKADVLGAVQTAPARAPLAPPRERPEKSPEPSSAPQAITAPTAGRTIRRQRMSRIRQRIAERLVEAQQTAAMLTTFNETDMSAVLHLRKRHKEEFLEKHGVGLGFMSFFVKACVSALKQYEGVNSYIVGDEIEYHDYVDVSIAVSTPRGLVVPVIRNADRMSFADIERAVKDLAERARDGQISIDEMTGGTFTVTNGGIYGSLQSTPILNPPQSGILGMHRIMNRPVEDAENPGQIVLRPMMYLALSYDHRLVDGEQAVKFLVHVKECIESPQRLLLGI